MGQTLALGQRFAERYTVVGTLGRGGMGAVYRAVDELLGETVALKVSVAPSNAGGRILVTDEQRREVAMARKVTHPNVARVHDLGVADSTMFLTMEFVDGPNLLARQRTAPLSLGEVVTIGRQLASALLAAHEVGVLHLDLKPQNVMLSSTRTLRAVLVDFGIAQVLGTTSAGFGTPDYVSPEQIAKQPLGGASDIYSLGLVLYELIAQQRAFEGESAQGRAMARLLTTPPSLAGMAPFELASLVGAMLARQPEARPTAAEIERLLCNMFDLPHTVPGVATSPPSLGSVEPPTARVSRSSDLGALPDGLGVALAEGHAALATVGHESQAIAAADAVLARDPCHDVALGLRALALTRKWHLTSFEGRDDVAERAAEAVAAALRGASHLATSHVADALVADYSGNFAYAARALRRAIAIDPMHAFAHEVLGRIEIEAGIGGIERLRLALALDGNRVAVLALVARELHFSGDVDGASNLLDELDRIRPDTSEARSLRCRIAVWERDVDAARRVRAMFPAQVPAIGGAFARMLDVVLGTVSFDEAHAYIATLESVQTSPKRRAFYYQLWAEFCGAFGRPEGLRYIVHAAQAPLSDLRWLDACSALDAYRREPAFKYAHTLVEDRLTLALRGA